MPAAWKTVRVFVSSTFRDMHAERDHLVKVTFPRLRQWCAQRRLHLIDIDLRWGVTRDEADNGKAIEICLQEIDGSRPFFVCLLGSRYGWVPEHETFPADALDRFHGLQARTHCSITHLEIIHAADASLSTRDARPACSQAFFYFRQLDCLPAAASLTHFSTEQRRAYDETFFEERNSRPADSLARLKAWVRERFGPGNRVFDYRGTWDADADNPEDGRFPGRLTRLDAFGEQVEQALRRGIEAQFTDHRAAGGPLDPLAEELALHEAFVANRTHVHVRRDVLREIDFYVHGDDSRPLLVTGPPGSGKSSLLARGVLDWAEERERGADAPTVVARFVGASPDSTTLPRLLASVCRELARDLGLNEELPADPEKLRQQWPRILEQAGRRRRLVVVLDALDQLERSADPPPLDWLPRPLPAGVRLVLSVLDTPGAGTDWLAALRTVPRIELRVPELRDEECSKMIKELPSVFCKRLDDEQVALLLRNRATRNPLFLTVALEELRVFGSFEKLPAVIAGLPPLDDAGNVEKALNGLFAGVLTRLEAETARGAAGLVAALFRLLAAARAGLSEDELRGLLAVALPQLAGAEREGALQVVLRQLRPYLMRKAARREVLIDFYHRSFLQAALTRHLNEPAARRQTARDLAAFFAAQPHSLGTEPNVRKAAELPWHLLRALAEPADDWERDWEALAALLGDEDFLRAKCRAGLADELANDFHRAHAVLPPAERHRAGPCVAALLCFLGECEADGGGSFNVDHLHSWLAYRTDGTFYLDLLAAGVAGGGEGGAGRRLARKCRGYLANLRRRAGELAEAERHFRVLLEDREGEGDLKWRSLVGYEVGYLSFLRGDLEEAARRFGESAADGLRASPPDPVGAGISACLEARARFLSGMLEAAREVGRQGEQLRQPGETAAAWMRRWLQAWAARFMQGAASAQFRQALWQAWTAFEAAAVRTEPDPRAVRWLMNVKAHLFEAACAARDPAGAERAFTDLQTDPWIRKYRPDWFPTYQARLAMLQQDWAAAVNPLREYLAADLAARGLKSEARAAVWLDLGSALVAADRLEEARAAWGEGLACPRDLGNGIWHDVIRVLEGNLDGLPYSS